MAKGSPALQRELEEGSSSIAWLPGNFPLPETAILIYVHKAIIKEEKREAAFQAAETKALSCFYHVSPSPSLLNSLSLDSSKEREAPFKCRFQMLAKSNK